MEKSLKSIAVNYGIYLGLILSLSTICCYLIDLALFNNLWILLITVGAVIVLGTMSILKVKNALGGFISFKQAFSSYFITIAFGLFISTVVYFTIFGIVDTDAAQVLADQQIERQIESMENWGAPQSVIDETLVKLEETDQFSIGNMALGYCVYLVIMSIIGLIVAAVTKRNDPNAV